MADDNTTTNAAPTPDSAELISPVPVPVKSRPKWMENKMDEVILGLALLPIAILSIIILKKDSVAIVTPIVTAYGMYMTGKQIKTGGNGDGGS